VTLAGRDVYDIADPDLTLLVLGRDDPVARRHDEDLVGRVRVQLVPGTVTKGMFGQAQIASLVADHRLGVDRADEDVGRVPRPLVH